MLKIESNLYTSRQRCKSPERLPLEPELWGRLILLISGNTNQYSKTLGCSEKEENLPTRTLRKHSCVLVSVCSQKHRQERTNKDVSFPVTLVCWGGFLPSWHQPISLTVVGVRTSLTLAWLWPASWQPSGGVDVFGTSEREAGSGPKAFWGDNH